MVITTLLAGDDAHTATQLDFAIALSARADLPLKGLSIMRDPASSVSYFASAEGVMIGAPSITEIDIAQKQALIAIKTLFDNRTSKHPDVKTTFASHNGNIQILASAEAALSDGFILTHGAAHSDHALNPIFEHILMVARLPLILGSSDGTGDGPAVIAWDGSAQAARAVRLHLKILQAYGHVIIAQQPDKVRKAGQVGDAASAQALADWLEGNGISSKIETFVGPVSEGLTQCAKAHAASMIVMGAYGHSRMGEMLFGGTSRALLNADSGPALALAH